MHNIPTTTGPVETPLVRGPGQAQVEEVWQVRVLLPARLLHDLPRLHHGIHSGMCILGRGICQKFTLLTILEVIPGLACLWGCTVSMTADRATCLLLLERMYEYARG